MLKHLTIILALHLAAGSQADAYEVGDVLYCSSENGAFASGKDTKVSLWSEKFKFQIKRDNSGNRITKFGEGGYFSQSSRDIIILAGDLLEARDSYSILTLRNGRFSFGYAAYTRSGFLNGTCDKF